MSGRCRVFVGHAPTTVHARRLSVGGRRSFDCPRAAAGGTGPRRLTERRVRLTDRRLELDEDARGELDRRQQVLWEHLAERPEVSVTWFRPDGKKDGGAYVTTTGRLKKIDEVERTLVLTDGMVIALDDVMGIDSSLFDRNGSG